MGVDVTADRSARSRQSRRPAGTQAVTIDGVLHAITGSPQVWMP